MILEATFQLLPVYVDISKHNPVLQTLSGPAVLLVWLYLMANVIVLGAEVNWWQRGSAPCRSDRRARPSLPSARAERLRGEGAVRVLGLPRVAELGDRPRLAARDEDRVEAEAALARRLAGDRAVEDAACRGTHARRVRAARARRRSARAVVAPSSAVERALDVAPLAQRAVCTPGRAAERGELDARVVGEHPAVRPARRCGRSAP